MHRVILAAVLALVTPATTGQSPDRPPNIDLARAVEDQTVAIRLFHTAESDAISHGSGFLIGKSDDTEDPAKDSLIFATAAHVIDGHDQPGVRVEIRYRDQDRWVPAKVILKTNRDTDLAVISVPRRDAAVDRGRPRLIPNAPHPGGRQDAWVFGYNPAGDRLEWRRLSTADIRGDLLELVGPGLEPGFSGGPIVNQVGRLGLIQSRGAAGENHRGIRTDAMAAILDEKNIPHTLGLDPVLAAMLNAQRKDLAVALYCLPRDGAQYMHFWAAIDLEREPVEGDFIGLCMTSHDPKAEPRIRMTPKDGGLLTVLDQPLKSWDRKSEIESRELRFHVDAEAAMKGFLVLRSDAGKDMVYMAIPTRGSELLPARALLSSRLGNAHHAETKTWPVPRILWHGNISKHGVVGAKIVPFSVVPPSRSSAMEIPFSVEGKRSMNGPVTVSGVWQAPDINDRRHANNPEHWSVGAAKIAGSPAPARLGKAGQPFEILLAAGTDGPLTFFVNRDTGRDIGGDQILIVGPVISYGALEDE